MSLRIFLALLFSVMGNAAGTDPCSDSIGQRAWETSPVYADAMDFAKSLRLHGIGVDCIRRSKEERLFEGQKGAAWFKTSAGVFEVWFLPKPRNFSDLQIIEQHTGDGRYTYSFLGAAHTPPVMNSPRPIAFIKDESALVEVWGGDRVMTDKLRAAIADSRR